MKRVLVLVEGSTEETFVKEVLAPHLATFGKWPEVTLVCSRREEGRRQFRGGGFGYGKFRKDLQLLLQSKPDVVTMMVDYYALRRDFPGWGTLPTQSTCFERVTHLETALANDIGDSRFIPNLMLHEFETLLFCSPESIATVLMDDKPLEALREIAKNVRTPEEINDGPETHPSKRLGRLFAGRYQKPLHGPNIAARIGLDTIRSMCEHFNAWLKRLEDV